MSCFTALEEFINKYHQHHQQTLNELPRYYPMGEYSKCIVDDYNSEDDEKFVHWKPVVRAKIANFENVEDALEIKLHQDINEFYGKLFSASVYFDSEFGCGELIQPWNDNDFELLQKNIIGHLMMKKKLKQAPTWFIGTINDSDKMITVDNENGSVWVEIPGNVPSEPLADSLELFFNKLRVKPTIPEAPQQMVDLGLDHPGIINSLKRMWQNLISRNHK